MKSLLLVFSLLSIYLTRPILKPLVKSSTNSVTKVYKSEKPNSFTVNDFSFNTKYIAKCNFKIYIKYSGISFKENMTFKYHFVDESGAEHTQVEVPKSKNYEEEIDFPIETLTGRMHIKFIVDSPLEGGEKIFSEFELAYGSVYFKLDQYEKALYYQVSYDFKNAATTCQGDYVKFLNVEHQYLLNEDYIFAFNDINMMIYAEMFYDSTYLRERLTLLNYSPMDESYGSSFGPFQKYHVELDSKKIDDYHIKIFNKTKFYVDLKTNTTYLKEPDVETIETYDIYLPKEDMDKFDIFRMQVNFFDFGSIGVILIFPIYLVREYIQVENDFEVVGKIDDEIDAEDLIEVVISGE